MKNYLFINLLILGFASVSFSQRNVDANCVITSPASSSVEYSGVPFNIAINISNSGPGDIKNGDTFFYYFTMNSFPATQTDTFIINQDIIPGGLYTLHINGFQKTTVTNNYAMNFCFVLSLQNRTDNLTDVSPVNNTSCITMDLLVTSSIDDITKSTGNSLYPNPACNVLNINGDFTGSNTFSIRLLNSDGKIVLYQNLLKLSGNHTHQINVSNLAEGVYICEIINQNKAVRQKVFIVR